MDLIGNIKFIENQLGGRKPNQSKGKSAQKNTGNKAVGEKTLQQMPIIPQQSTTPGSA